MPSLLHLVDKWFHPTFSTVVNSLMNFLAPWVALEQGEKTVRDPYWIWILTSGNNVTHKWFQAEVPGGSNSPSIIEALCYSSPSLITLFNLLFLPCMTLCSLSTPTEHFDSLSLSITSINLSLTPSLHPSMLTPFSPTTHELFLMHFVSLSCSLCAYSTQLSISVTSYSKLYTSVHSSVLFRHTGQEQGAKCVNVHYAV